MKKFLIFVILIITVIGISLIFDRSKFLKEENMEEEIINNNFKNLSVREPAVAGAFYPGNKEELERVVERYLSQAQVQTDKKYIKALIVPHAGYDYSGWVAAYGYKLLENRAIKRVILIGNSHSEYFDGASVYPEGYFKTPLGLVEIDKDFVERLKKSSNKIYFKETTHLKEHSLEVQLPFLQKTLKGFKIVPILLGNQEGVVDDLVNTLKNLIDDTTLVIASSDLSHYPKYEDAQFSDNEIIKAILTGKRENLEKTIREIKQKNIPNLQTCACGRQAIEVVMGLMENKDVEIKLLKYANSGDLPADRQGVEIGDKSHVVGYAAIAFVSDKSEDELGLEEKKRLLEIAREAVEVYVKEGRIIEVEEENPFLNKHLGAFVTLKKHGKLRGCIGVFEPDIPLYQVVRDMAIAAATKDNRFFPVSKDELGELEYEISVLSPLRKVDSWREIEIGKHGVQIRKGLRSGVFLPQVATENNWDLDTFMSTLCVQKVGLPADCWKDPETEIYVFTAQVFGENEVENLN